MKRVQFTFDERSIMTVDKLRASDIPVLLLGQRPWEKAADHASEFCRQHPTWQRICDLADGQCDKLMLEFRELPGETKRHWRGKYHESAEDAWREFGVHPCRVDFGHVDEDGNFWRRSIPPMGKNMMMVFDVNGPRGIWWPRERPTVPDWAIAR